MRMKLRSVRDALLRRRHLSAQLQGEWLASVVRDYFAYHAVPTNVNALGAFRTQVTRHCDAGALVPEVRFDVWTQGRSRAR
jgi:hypothetical protein